MKNKSLFGYPAIKKSIVGVRKKLFLCLLLAAFQSVSAQAPQQNLSLRVQERPLREIMDSIERQTEYRFYYNSKLHDLQRRISILAENEPVRSVLTGFSNRCTSPIRLKVRISFLPIRVMPLPCPRRNGAYRNGRRP